MVVVAASVRKDMSMTLCLLAIASKHRESHEKKIRPGKHSFPCARDRRAFVLAWVPIIYLQNSLLGWNKNKDSYGQNKESSKQF